MFQLPLPSPIHVRGSCAETCPFGDKNAFVSEQMLLLKFRNTSEAESQREEGLVGEEGLCVRRLPG